MNRGNIFTKVAILIVFLLIPVLVLYFYSNHVSNNVASTEIKRLNREQLSFFVNQVEMNMDNLAMNTMTLGRIQSIKDFKTVHLVKDPMDYIQIKDAAIKTIEQQNISNNWKNEIVVYSPNSKELISTTASSFNIENLYESEKNRWNHHTVIINGKEQHYFSWYSVEPWSKSSKIREVNLVIGISFSESILQERLDQFKNTGRNDPFFYNLKDPPITSRTANNEMVRAVISELQKDIPLNENNEKIVKIYNKNYMISYVYSNRLGSYLVDYAPFDTLMAPIKSSRNLFYFSVGLLLITGIFAAFILYRHVHVPINQLIHGVNSIRLGDYSVRIPNLPKNEFAYLIKSYNEMAQQIQILIEKVYEEEVRSKEAILKQLQSQINPHFLYNSLFFIKNMSKLGNQKALNEMVHNLAEYYRYTTRVDKHLVTLNDEINLIENYLNIYTLRMDRISFNISIPEDMKEEKILRLIIQPIVENAIVHGLEPKVGKGNINITGKIVSEKNIIVIEDDGVGMDPFELNDLKGKVSSPINTRNNYGIWNVHQRLLLYFGTGSGIELFVPESGGFRVVLSWNRVKQ
ncbi:sensor histidine kinase [Lederbergia wuyishanensis]|uniref:Two-component system sensor histidine kinase YesM n=1 Tax=Lederbergia wuyishanensis TaxID=1347903 RepID=A0ABU0D4V2_9BACI|nr:histidine kinase [Lederbergia wuyishanensis]MCJ8009525.1 histidine kinase [Lederbergia wuyishanensis]MDQ0343430.1 two-component system sensor histidine kinase YesM [Lederbergia wuyishanensis]